MEISVRLAVVENDAERDSLSTIAMSVCCETRVRIYSRHFFCQFRHDRRAYLRRKEENWIWMPDSPCDYSNFQSIFKLSLVLVNEGQEFYPS